MNIPAKVIRAFLPKEVKVMLEALKGKKTLLGLLVVGLTPVLNEVSQLLGLIGLSQQAELVVKVGGSLLAVVGYVLKFIPDTEVK